MMPRRSLLRIDNSKSGRRRVALQKCASISARAGGPSIDLIDIILELTGSPTLYGSYLAVRGELATIKERIKSQGERLDDQAERIKRLEGEYFRAD